MSLLGAGSGRLQLRLAALGLCAVLGTGGAAGCGGARPGPTVARVGGTAVGKRTVEHWASVIERGGIVANVTDPDGSPKQQALEMLIYARWLIGEASREGLRPSSGEIERAVQAQERQMPNGPDEFRKLLAASGETLADVEFEARARWAAVALARRLAAAVERQARARVTGVAVMRFYHEHAAQYHWRERRYYDLKEGIPSRAVAKAQARRLGSGARFTRVSSQEQPFRPRTFARLPGQAVIYRAVFAGKVGVLTGPLPDQGHYALFVLRRIDPPRVQPLTEVRGAIERRLLAAGRRTAASLLTKRFHELWISRTSCRAGYVVQKCRQYAGPRKRERDPLSNF